MARKFLFQVDDPCKSNSRLGIEAVRVPKSQMRRQPPQQLRGVAPN